MHKRNLPDYKRRRIIDENLMKYKVGWRRADRRMPNKQCHPEKNAFQERRCRKVDSTQALSFTNEVSESSSEPTNSVFGASMEFL